jgi:quercetin dioxygenase-like cupin family protein
MDIKTVQSMTPAPVTMEGASGVTMKVVFSDHTGAPNFAMRVFEVQPGGHTPLHHHPYEHEVMILEGRGELKSAEGKKPFQAGEAVYVAPDELHQFQNTGGAPLKFLCMIPNQKPLTLPSPTRGEGIC